MAEKKSSGFPSPSMPPTSQQNGGIGEAAPKLSPPSHQNGRLDQEDGHRSSGSSSPVLKLLSASSSRPSESTSALRTLGGLVTSVRESAFPRARGQSLSSAMSSRIRTPASRNKRRSSQQEEPEALLDLILESQGQRLDDQRASLSLLPEPGAAAALCETCLGQPHAPGLDFYYMLIHYQSDRMEDQRCSLPELEDMIGPVPEGQEDFFSLIQRVQSKRMDEQRVSFLMTHTDDNSDTRSDVPPDTTIADEGPSLKMHGQGFNE